MSFACVCDDGHFMAYGGWMKKDLHWGEGMALRKAVYVNGIVTL